MKTSGLLLIVLLVSSRAVLADTVPVGPAVSIDHKAGERPAIAAPASPQTAGTKTEDAYWIGVRVAPVPEVLLPQFAFPEADKGLVVVEEVVADGPAAKAELSRGDILLSFAGRGIHHFGDLVSQVARAKETPQKLEIVRGGRKKELTVTPAKRPTREETVREQALLPQKHQVMRFSPEEMMREMENYFRRMQGGADDESVAVFEENIRPGESNARQIEVDSRIDKDGKTTVRVTRKIRNGDAVEEKSWEAESVDRLPADIRDEVRKVIGGL